MRPLDGITVVTLEHAIAAPFCTRHVADLGARVIKIERPGVGDFARAYDERVKGLASHFVWTNRSKKSLPLDVKHKDGQAIQKRAPRGPRSTRYVLQVLMPNGEYAGHQPTTPVRSGANPISAHQRFGESMKKNRLSIARPATMRTTRSTPPTL
jgi:hypothetical protein